MAIPTIQLIGLTAEVIKNLSALATLPNLRSVDLSSPSSLDLSPIGEIASLFRLHIYSAGQLDLSPLARCHELQRLSLYSPKPLELRPIAGLIKLLNLSFGIAPITNLSPLAGLRNLVSLTIQSKAFDIGPIAGLTNLQTLDIRETGAKDLTPLTRLVGLMIGTQKNPTYGGLSFTSTVVSDAFIRSIGRRGRVHRARSVLEYLRRKAGLSTLNEAIAEWQKNSEFESNWESVVGTIPFAAAGAKFVVAGDQISLDQAGDQTDYAAAELPLTEQLHEGVKRRSALFSEMAMRLDNQPGWRGIGSAATRYRDAVSRPAKEIPDIIGTVYDTLIELGSFLEFDNHIRDSTDENATPLDMEVQRAFGDLIRTSAPWVRQFPTARKLDEETGAFFANTSLRGPSQSVADAAESIDLISPADATAIHQLLDASERGATQGQKAGTRGVATARNLTLKAMALVATFHLGAISSDVATKSTLVQRAGTFLAKAEDSVLPLFADLSADIRQALLLMLEDVQREVPPPVPRAPPELFDRRRKPDEDDN